MVVVGVVEPITGAEEQASQNENRRQPKQNNFNVHVLTSLSRLDAKGKTADFEGDFCNAKGTYRALRDYYTIPFLARKSANAPTSGKFCERMTSLHFIQSTD